MGQIDKWGQRLTYGVGGYLAYKLFYDLKTKKIISPHIRSNLTSLKMVSQMILIG